MRWRDRFEFVMEAIKQAEKETGERKGHYLNVTAGDMEEMHRRAEMKKRESDTLQFILPQREHADIVVRFHPDAGVKPENAGPNLNVQLVLRPTIPHPDLTYLIDGTHHASTDVRLRLGRDGGRPVDFLEIARDVCSENAMRLEEAIWQHLPDLRPVREDQFGVYQDRTEVRHSHPLALSQLLITYHLLRKYNNLSEIPFAPPVAALSRLQSKQVTLTEDCDSVTEGKMTA